MMKKSHGQVDIYFIPLTHFHSLFYDGGRYHIATSPLICTANHWTGFYMIMASVMKELNLIL